MPINLSGLLNHISTARFSGLRKEKLNTKAFANQASKGFARENESISTRIVKREMRILLCPQLVD